MWPTGPGTATYTLYINPNTTLRYNYFRNGDPDTGPEIIGTDANPPAHRTIAVGSSDLKINDTIQTWRNQMLEFWLGNVAGNVWLDSVRLSASPPVLYRRDFTDGVVLLNGAAKSQNVALEPGFRRFSGSQAPLWQYMVDDAAPDFSADSSWQVVTYNSGDFHEGHFQPPFYHAWNNTAHLQNAAGTAAQWNLNIPADGQYTVQIWLPAAPGASNWTKGAVYEIVAGGNVVTSATIDQTAASVGDAWHQVATVNLKVADAPFLRVHNGGVGALIADAVYITSAAFYNDGSPAPQVTLSGFDGILLQRQTPVPVPASRVNSVVNAASYQPAIASGGFVSIVGTGFTNSSRSWASADFSGNNLPTSLDGVSVTINGKPAYVEYISPTQIN